MNQDTRIASARNQRHEARIGTEHVESLEGAHGGQFSSKKKAQVNVKEFRRWQQQARTGV